MVHRLRAYALACGCYNTQRYQIRHVTCGRSYSSAAATTRAEVAAGVTADVQVVQIPGVRALLVFDFQNHLVLVVWLLDQVNVILRVGIAHQALDRGS